MDRVGIEDFDTKYELIGNIYFEKREEPKKKEKTVAVAKEVVISPKEEAIKPMAESEEPTDDELREFLKDKNVKSAHLFGRAKLLAKAEEYGFTFNK